MNAPRISILMGVYNAERYLREAIDSLLTQTFSDFEAIVVNDASADGSAEILASYDDPRLRTVHNAENLGHPASLNRALGLAKAPLIARMDADDIAEPDRLARQLQTLERRPELDVLGTWTREIDEAGNEIGRFSFPASEALIRWGLAKTNVVYHPTVLMRRSILDRVEGYRPAVECADDYDLFTRILIAGGRIDNLAERLLRYRRSGGQTSTRRVEQQHREARRVRARYVAWLTGEEPPDPVVDAAVELQAPDGRIPDPAVLVPALGLARAIRRGAGAGASPAGRRLVRDHARRALLSHSARLRASGRGRDAVRVWLAAGRSRGGWRQGDVLRQGFALLTGPAVPREAG